MRSSGGGLRSRAATRPSHAERRPGGQLARPNSSSTRATASRTRTSGPRSIAFNGGSVLPVIVASIPLRGLGVSKARRRSRTECSRNISVTRTPVLLIGILIPLAWRLATRRPDRRSVRRGAALLVGIALGLVAESHSASGLSGRTPGLSSAVGAGQRSDSERTASSE